MLPITLKVSIPNKEWAPSLTGPPSSSDPGSPYRFSKELSSFLSSPPSNSKD